PPARQWSRACPTAQPVSRLYLPEQGHRAQEARRLANQRNRHDLDVALTAVHALDPEGAARGLAARQRDHERQLLRCDWFALLVVRSEYRCPFQGRHGAGLVEAVAEYRLGLLVVIQQIAMRVHQEDRQRQVTRQLARQDDFNLFPFSHGSPQSSLAFFFHHSYVALRREHLVQCRGGQARTSPASDQVDRT